MKSNLKIALETVCGVDNPHLASETSAANEVRDVLSQILRDGAPKMLQAAIRKEIDEYLQDRFGIVGEDGRRLVIRNGPLPERELITGPRPGRRSIRFNESTSAQSAVRSPFSCLMNWRINMVVHAVGQ